MGGCGQVITILILSIQIKSGQIVYTQIRLLFRSRLIRIYTVCHSVCIFWTYCMVKPLRSNFRRYLPYNLRQFFGLNFLDIYDISMSLMQHYFSYMALNISFEQTRTNYFDSVWKCFESKVKCCIVAAMFTVLSSSHDRRIDCCSRTIKVDSVLTKAGNRYV